MEHGYGDLLQQPEQQRMNDMSTRQTVQQVHIEELFAQLHKAQTDIVQITNEAQRDRTHLQAALALIGLGEGDSTTATAALQIVSVNNILAM
eukprot:13760826-Heterocapsa_arctica.AAC.1